MQGFINHIVIFINQIYQGILQGIRTQISVTAYDKYLLFLDKNIFTENSIIGINISWSELFIYITIWFLFIFFIVLIVKLFCSFLKIFEL